MSDLLQIFAEPLATEDGLLVDTVVARSRNHPIVPPKVPPSSLVQHKALDKPHKFGCLMLLLPQDVTKEITDWAIENVPDVHLGPGGRELRSHVTCAYGFEDDAGLTDELNKLMSRNGPVTIALSALSIFEGDNPDGTPLKIDVTSPELIALHEAIAGTFPLPGSKWPDFKPHLTLAFLQPEVAASYVGLPAPFIGKQVTLTQAEYSAADGTMTPIPLTFLPMFGRKAAPTQQHAAGVPFKGPSGSWFMVDPKSNRVVPTKAPGSQQQQSAPNALQQEEPQEPLPAEQADATGYNYTPEEAQAEKKWQGEYADYALKNKGQEPEPGLFKRFVTGLINPILSTLEHLAELSAKVGVKEGEEADARIDGMLNQLNPAGKGKVNFFATLILTLLFGKDKVTALLQEQVAKKPKPPETTPSLPEQADAEENAREAAKEEETLPPEQKPAAEAQAAGGQPERPKSPLRADQLPPAAVGAALADWVRDYRGQWLELAMSPQDLANWDAAFDDPNTTDSVPEPPGWVDRHPNWQEEEQKKRSQRPADWYPSAEEYLDNLSDEERQRLKDEFNKETGGATKPGSFEKWVQRRRNEQKDEAKQQNTKIETKPTTKVDQPEQRPNADLDEIMQQKPLQPPKVPPGKLRHNPDLDDVFGKGLKALSWLNSNNGGALVEPPAQKRTTIKLLRAKYGRKSVGTCKPGERSDLTGCTPASGHPTGKPALQPPAVPPIPGIPARLKNVVSKGYAKAKQIVAAYTQALDEATDVLVIREAKQISAKLKNLTQAFATKVTDRYGRVGGVCVLASGQMLGWGTFAAGSAMGVPLWLPGSSIWGSLPGAAVAEVLLQTTRMVRGGKALTPADDTRKLTPELAERLWNEFIADLMPVYFAELKRAGVLPNTGEKQMTYQTKDRNVPCKQGETSEQTGCIPASGDTKKPPAKTNKVGGKAPPKKVAKPAAVRLEMTAARREGEGKDAKIVLADGQPAPAHITPAMVPPGWVDVQVSTDPNADVLVTARDAKGNTKTVYSDKWDEGAAARKFARIHDCMQQGPAIAAQIQRDRADPKKMDSADCAWLMNVQGTRPGSEADNKGVGHLFGQPLSTENVVLGEPDKQGVPSVTLKVGNEEIPIRDKKARAEIARRVKQGDSLEDTGYWLKSHGATTLEGRNVVVTGAGVLLRFMGKESVWHEHYVRDPKLAEMLKERKNAAGNRGKLFPRTNDAKVNAYVSSLDGGKFTPKDLRTRRGTEMALKEIARRDAPQTEKDYKKTVMEIAGIVSGVLGNEPAVCLSTYISPVVFSGWRAGLVAAKKTSV